MSCSFRYNSENVNYSRENHRCPILRIVTYDNGAFCSARGDMQLCCILRIDSTAQLPICGTPVYP